MKQFFLGLGALVTFSGCVSVLPEQVVPDSLYRLHGASYQPQGEVVSLSKSVTVFAPEGTSLLLGRAIAFESDTGGLSVVPEAQWSDTAARHLSALLVERLSKGRDGNSGAVLSELDGARTDVELRWQVRDFVVREADAVASFRVTLLSSRQREVLGQFDVTETVGYSGDIEDGVAALIDAARLSVDAIALGLPAYF